MPRPELKKRTARSARSAGSTNTQTVPSTQTNLPANTSSQQAQQSTIEQLTPSARKAAMNRDSRNSFGMVDFAGQYKGWRALLNPLGCYYGFIAAVGILTVFGVIMVFSSSSVDMVAAGASPWAKALNQGIFCILGLIIALFVAHVPGRRLEQVSFVLYALSVAIQYFTVFFGVEVAGNRGWLRIGGFQFQPAEFMKFTICLWFPLAMISAIKKKPGIKKTYKAWDLGDWGRTFGFYGLGLLAVLLGKDLGTALIIILIGLMAIVASGFSLKYVAMVGALAAVVVAALTLMSSNRMSRIIATYTGCTADNADVCYQATHSNYALASGGLLGVGLGNSREKWNYLPAAHNDFIFAIIGEETGFIGAALVILLFVVIAWCLIAVAMQLRNRYASVALLCFMMWIVGQALINIAVVVEIFPVMGVPLPFVSAGGSSMIFCLAAAGACVALMRMQPEIKAAHVRA